MSNTKNPAPLILLLIAENTTFGSAIELHPTATVIGEKSQDVEKNKKITSRIGEALKSFAAVVEKYQIAGKAKIAISYNGKTIEVKYKSNFMNLNFSVLLNVIYLVCDRTSDNNHATDHVNDWFLIGIANAFGLKATDKIGFVAYQFAITERLRVIRGAIRIQQVNAAMQTMSKNDRLVLKEVRTVNKAYKALLESEK